MCSNHISGCSFILSEGEGVGANICCGHSSCWAFDLLLFQVEENALPHAWSILSRPGEEWEFRLPPCTSFSHFLPIACVHDCAPSACVGAFSKDLSDLLVFPLLPSHCWSCRNRLYYYCAASKSSFWKQALLLTRQDFDF